MGTSTNKYRITNPSTNGPSRKITTYLKNFNLSIHNNDINSRFFTRDPNTQQIHSSKNITRKMMQAVAKTGQATFGAWAVDNDSQIINEVINRILAFSDQELDRLEKSDDRREFCRDLIQEVFSDLPHAEDQDMLIYYMDQALDDILTLRTREELTTVNMIYFLVEAALQSRFNLIIENHIENNIIINDDLHNHTFISTIRTCIRNASQLCTINIPINTRDFTDIVRELWLEIISIIQGD